MSSSGSAHIATAYQALCTSYHNIDGFRGTLLGMLPLATSGVFLLGSKDGTEIFSHPGLAFPIGLFGFFIALGLFIFEIYGIRRCTHLIILGQHLERQMKVQGQFLSRPNGIEGFNSSEFAKFVSEPMASGVIYPSVCAAWLYLGLKSLNPIVAAVISTLFALLGFYFTMRYNCWLGGEDWQKTKGELLQDSILVDE